MIQQLQLKNSAFHLQSDPDGTRILHLPGEILMQIDVDQTVFVTLPVSHLPGPALLEVEKLAEPTSKEEEVHKIEFQLLPNGSYTIELPDHTIVQRNIDGSAVFLTPKGDKVSIFTDGHQVEEFLSGEGVLEHREIGVDGKMIEVFRDGARDEFSLPKEITPTHLPFIGAKGSDLAKVDELAEILRLEVTKWSNREKGVSEAEATTSFYQKLMGGKLLLNLSKYLRGAAVKEREKAEQYALEIVQKHREHKIEEAQKLVKHEIAVVQATYEEKIVQLQKQHKKELEAVTKKVESQLRLRFAKKSKSEAALRHEFAEEKLEIAGQVSTLVKKLKDMTDQKNNAEQLVKEKEKKIEELLHENIKLSNQVQLHVDHSKTLVSAQEAAGRLRDQLVDEMVEHEKILSRKENEHKIAIENLSRMMQRSPLEGEGKQVHGESFPQTTKVDSLKEMDGKERNHNLNVEVEKEVEKDEKKNNENLEFSPKWMSRMKQSGRAKNNSIFWAPGSYRRVIATAAGGIHNTGCVVTTEFSLYNDSTFIYFQKKKHRGGQHSLEKAVSQPVAAGKWRTVQGDEVLLLEGRFKITNEKGVVKWEQRELKFMCVHAFEFEPLKEVGQKWQGKLRRDWYVPKKIGKHI
eukprot:g3742.t1